jgi:hypothetical protein
LHLLLHRPQLAVDPQQQQQRQAIVQRQRQLVVDPQRQQQPQAIVQRQRQLVVDPQRQRHHLMTMMMIVIITVTTMMTMTVMTMMTTKKQTALPFLFWHNLQSVSNMSRDE